MSKHTPTPWEARPVPNAKIIAIAEVGYMHHAEVFSRKHNNEPLDETAYANAEFIVRACNNHDALVAALENLDNAINEPSLGIDIIRASDKARAILRTVKGE